MKKLILLFLLFSVTLYSQSPTFPIGTQWTYEYTQYPQDHHYPKTHIITDTVQWEGHLAYKIEPGFYMEDVDYIKQEDNKIWFWSYETEAYQLHYDFDATDYYLTEYYSGGPTFVTDTVFVDSIGIQNLNGVDYSIQYLRSNAFWETLNNYEVIHSIGSKDKGLFLRLGFYEANFTNDSYDIWCHDNTEAQYQLVDFPCDSSWTTSTFNPLSKNVQLSPNPATDKLTIEGLDNVDISIYDLTGKEYIKTKSIQNKLGIDLTDFPNGVYFIKFVHQDQFITKTFIKN